MSLWSCNECSGVHLALGADPNSCGNYALNCAIENCEPEVVAVLLKAGADVNAVRDLDGKTPLDAAQRVVCSKQSWINISGMVCVRRGVVGALLRAGATIQPRHASPTPRGMI